MMPIGVVSSAPRVWRSGIEGDPRKDATKEGRPLYRASSPIVNLIPCSSGASRDVISAGSGWWWCSPVSPS
jgi:hypothetical protein